MQGTGTMQEGFFTTRLTTSINFDYGDSLQIDSDSGEMLVLREVAVAAADTGLVEVIVKCDPGHIFSNGSDDVKAIQCEFDGHWNETLEDCESR